MDKKICLKCSTENDGNFVFCKYCGAMLPVVDKRYNYPQSEEDPSQQIEEPEIDGVSLNDMSLYIGKRPHKFIPKFIRMEATRQKISSCIPVLLLGVFFGLFGVSIWFFWRKMPKIGLLFVLFGLLLNFADLAVNYTTYSSYIDGIFELFADVKKNPHTYSDPAVLNQAVNSEIAAFQAGFNPVISLISRYVGSLMVPSVTSLFALYIYKRKAVADIKQIKSDPVNSVSAETRIAIKGGCSGLMVLIPIAANALSACAIFAICLF